MRNLTVSSASSCECNLSNSSGKLWIIFRPTSRQRACKELFGTLSTIVYRKIADNSRCHHLVAVLPGGDFLVFGTPEASSPFVSSGESDHAPTSTPPACRRGNHEDRRRGLSRSKSSDRAKSPPLCFSKAENRLLSGRDHAFSPGDGRYDGNHRLKDYRGPEIIEAREGVAVTTITVVTMKTVRRCPSS